MQKTFSSEFMKYLSLKMKEKSFAPGEIIIERGQKLSELFFITRGETEYFYNKHDSLKYLSEYENKVIDIRAFMTQLDSDLSIRSKGITIVAYIDYSTFIDTLQHYSADKEKFCFLRDQFLHDSRYQYPCKSCGLFQHNIFNCPQLTYQVNKVKFLQKFTERITQNRDSDFDRFDKVLTRQKFNALSQNVIVRQELKIIRCDLANFFYGQQFPLMNFVQIPYLNQDDKQFLQQVPKINLQWFEGEFLLGQNFARNNQNQNGYPDHEDNPFQTFTSSSNASDSSSSSFHSRTNTRSKATIGINEKMPSINTDLRASFTAGFNQIDKMGYHPNVNKNDTEMKSDFLIPSENKIPLPIPRVSTTQLPHEDVLSPSSYTLLPQEYHQNQQGNEYSKIEQIINLQKLNRKSLTKKDKSRQRTTNITQSINTNSDYKIQSRASFTKPGRGEPLSPKGQSSIDSFDVSVPIQGISMNQVNLLGQVNSSLHNDKFINPTATNQILGLQRVSVMQSQMQGQMQSQIQYIYEMLKNQQRFNDKFQSFHSRSIKTKKTYKPQFDQVYEHQHRRTITTLSKNKSLLGVQTQDACSMHVIPENHNFFGKCGYQFESFKEYIFYYQKFNYSFVIRAYKKQQQINQKRIRQTSMFCNYKHSQSQKVSKKKQLLKGSSKFII